MSQSGQRSKYCLSNNSKTTEAKLMTLHRKVEHNEKVCRAQELGSYAQGQGHNQVKGQIVPKLCCSKTTEANLIKLHRKIKHIEKVCRAHDLGSFAQGQGRNQVKGQNIVSAITQKLLKQIERNFTER